MNTTHKFCAKCGAHKPLAEFKRLLTRAQMKARGYLGHVRMEIESKLCKACQPKPKTIEQLTIKQIRTRVSTGDINEMLAESIIKERLATVNQRRSAKTSARWAQIHHKAWQDLVYSISEEVTIVRQQLKYANTLKDPLRYRYANTYLGLLNTLRARLRFAALKPQGAPESTYWAEHFDPEDKTLVREVWEAIPLATRTRMKIPLLLVHRAGDEGENKPQLHLKLDQRVTANERLAHGIQIKLEPRKEKPSQSIGDWSDM